MTLVSEAVLDSLDWEAAVPCTWGVRTHQCENTAAWTVTCLGCGGIAYRCDHHLRVEKVRANTAPVVECPFCHQPFKTRGGGLDAVAEIRHL